MIDVNIARPIFLVNQERKITLGILGFFPSTSRAGMYPGISHRTPSS